MTDGLAKAEQAALDRIATLTEPDRLRTLIENARRMESRVVEAEAFRRLCEVQPEATPGTVEFDVWRSIHTMEEMLRTERGKTVRLSRTRQKICKDDEAKTAADLTRKPDASAGFHDLIDRGHPELTFEAVVLRHPRTFDEPTTHAARKRLEEAGLSPDAFLATDKESSNG